MLAGGTARRLERARSSAARVCAVLRSERPVAASSAVAARSADPHRGGLSGARWRPLSGQADRRRAFEVWADLFRDGHDKLRAVVKYRREDEEWRETPFVFSTTIAGSAASGSIRSASGGTRSRPGPTISKAGATRSKRSAAGQNIELELVEGGRSSRPRCSRPRAGDAARIREMLRDFEPPTAPAAPSCCSRPNCATLMARCSVRSDAVRYPRELEVVVDRKAARFAAWYEMFPRSQGSEPGKGATFRRLHRAPPRDRAARLRCRLSRADPPDRPGQPQGQRQQHGCRAGRPRQPLRDRFGGGRPPRGQPRARHARRFPPLCRAPPRRSAWRWRSISRSSARPTIPGCASIRNGSASGPTERSNTPRTRRRNTRTSSTSISTTRTARDCGPNCATRCCSGSTRACAPSGSTTRTPSRCRSGNG